MSNNDQVVESTRKDCAEYRRQEHDQASKLDWNKDTSNLWYIQWHSTPEYEAKGGL